MVLYLPLPKAKVSQSCGLPAMRCDTSTGYGETTVSLIVMIKFFCHAQFMYNRVSCVYIYLHDPP